MRPRITGATFDCRDPLSLAGFWGQVLGWDVAHWSGEQGARITGPGRPEFRIGFASVPEPKVARNRFHFDLETGSVDEEIARLEGLRATVVGEHIEHSWDCKVMEDPEGNEFCVGRLANRHPPPGRADPGGVALAGFGFDCLEPARLAAFWSELLGFDVTARLDGGTLIQDPGVGGRWIWFQEVPEPKVAKNRLHPDLEADDYRAEVERAKALGATVFAEHGDEIWDWDVVQDPEGNEFCLGRPRTEPGG